MTTLSHESQGIRREIRHSSPSPPLIADAPISAATTPPSYGLLQGFYGGTT